MEYAIAVFILGLMVTALVFKGLLMSHEFTKQELQRRRPAERVSDTEG